VLIVKKIPIQETKWENKETLGVPKLPKRTFLILPRQNMTLFGYRSNNSEKIKLRNLFYQLI
jgi:hypothetical protein